jgi:heme/copper-type cytochrome/quinol oxidase subunit 3
VTAAATTVTAVPVEATRRRAWSTSVWGMFMVILTEGTIFLVLLAAYFFLRASSKQWPPPGIEAPDLTYALPFSFVLWGSSLPIFWAEAALRKGRLGPVKAGLALSWLMGLSFVLVSLHDFDSLHYGWRDNAYGSIYYTIVGLHLLHVVVGLTMNVVIQLKAWMGRYARGRAASAEAFFLYWHFVDVVWLAVFPSVLLSPHWQ